MEGALKDAAFFGLHDPGDSVRQITVAALHAKAGDLFLTIPLIVLRFAPVKHGRILVLGLLPVLLEQVKRHRLHAQPDVEEVVFGPGRRRIQHGGELL